MSLFSLGVQYIGNKFVSQIQNVTVGRDVTECKNCAL